MSTPMDCFCYLCGGEGDVRARQDKLSRIQEMERNLQSLQIDQLNAEKAEDFKMKALLDVQIQRAENNLQKEQQNVSWVLWLAILFIFFLCIGAICLTVYQLLQP